MKTNLVAYGHVIMGILAMAFSWPLIKRKVKMNSFYGVRIAAAFRSDRQWYDINEYGGRLFYRLGILIIITGLIGIAIPAQKWISYSWASLVIILGGLLVVVIAINRYAGRTKKP